MTEEAEEEEQQNKWERLVPGMLLRLRVLLVESDDSTRRVISALLRKSSYRVMSSKDSISTILKCMLKGAADYLIKPVRWNKLRNLWQHVWRRRIGCSELETENSSNLNNTKRQEECVKTNEESALCESGTETNGNEHEELLPSYSCRVVRVGDNQICAKSTLMDLESPKQIACSINEMDYETKELVNPQAVDLIQKFDNRQLMNRDGLLCGDDSTDKINVSPRLELSLHRSFSSISKDERNEEQHKLGHSKASAFSRYDSRKTREPVYHAISGYTVSEEVTNASENQFFDPLPAFYAFWEHYAELTKRQRGLAAPVHGQSEKPGSAFSRAQLGFFALPGLRSDILFASYGFYPPMVYAQPGCSPVWSPESQPEHLSIPTSSSVHSTSEVGKPEGGLCSVEEETKTEEMEQSDDIKLETAKAISFGSTFGSYDVCNNSTNASGASIYCTSEENVTRAPAFTTADVSDRISDDHLLLKSEPEETVLRCSSQREAALIKFRLRRKDRCYGKKLRYQSRKRLAEQRPRVKGQFCSSGAN